MTSDGLRASHSARLMCMLAIVFALFVPSVACAQDYSMGPVSIDATIREDGTLDVVETRRFDFDGAFHGVYWKLVKGSFQGRDVEPVVVQIGEVRDGSLAVFEQSDTEKDGTYTLTDYAAYDELKIYSAHSDDTAEFQISYTYPGLVSRWDDTSELYWKFVSDGWDRPTDDVTCTVHLPVPSGASVLPGQNVRAWGHGPLDANVAFEGSDVVFTVPRVGTREFAEVRVTFPEEWLPAAERTPGSRIDAVLAEEQQWADEANAQRDRARLLVYGVSAAFGLLGAALLVVALVTWVGYKKAHKPQFCDEYYRDIPSDDHPALLGALYQGGKADKDCFTASLMRLADMGKIQLDLIAYGKRGMLGRSRGREDYRLLEVERVEGGLRGDAVAAARDRIDRAAMKFLFDTVASHHEQDPSLVGPNGERYLLSSYFEEVSRTHPEAYQNGYDNWCAAVSSSIEARRFTTDDEKRSKAMNVGMGVAGIFAGVGVVFAAIVLELPVLLAVLLALLNIAGAVVNIVLATTMTPRSREAIELTAKLKALRRWLKDFTRLEEAIPTDVVLWNRLLVMATALGVADDVVRQLKVANPRLLDDPLFYNYGWYDHGDREIDPPARVMSAAFGQAHGVSAARTASSSSSSGRGSGGGFSSGGGGGFGGGGGGGAF